MVTVTAMLCVLTWMLISNEISICEYLSPCCPALHHHVMPPKTEEKKSTLAKQTPLKSTPILNNVEYMRGHSMHELVVAQMRLLVKFTPRRWRYIYRCLQEASNRCFSPFIHLVRNSWMKSNLMKHLTRHAKVCALMGEDLRLVNIQQCQVSIFRQQVKDHQCVRPALRPWRPGQREG